MGALTQGSKLSFYVNGFLLKTIYDTSISSGRVGVYMGTRDYDLAEVSFSRLTILTAQKALADWTK